jgi:hypothetical protein
MSAARAVNLLTDTELDQLCVNTIRTLSIYAVQQAKSGHPGMPMALAPLIYTIVPLSLYWIPTLGVERYMGEDQAEAYGRRNSGPGELLVRVKPVKITGEKDVAGW